MPHESGRGGAHAGSGEAHSIWAADPVHLPHIRSHTRRWLAPLGLNDDTEQDLVLAVNEAASNAIEHAYFAPGPSDLVTVSFWLGLPHLYVQVADQGRWRRPDAAPGHRGRGLLIMRKVIESVSIHKGPDGTRVVFRHPVA